MTLTPVFVCVFEMWLGHMAWADIKHIQYDSSAKDHFLSLEEFNVCPGCQKERKGWFDRRMQHIALEGK